MAWESCAPCAARISRELAMMRRVRSTIARISDASCAVCSTFASAAHAQGSVIGLHLAGQSGIDSGA
ncbi:hypothetical protein [Methylorubrum aminovorans]|uniref:hypothetical protein n=1 Tax=Methylorubrum aminovorans TaxID=269069 RepID=UPI0024E14842|nr:hypothetical protein [Methylorubrum aminovorans]